MKLLIENIAKIDSASLLLDGVTVVAGNNNTGKSTVGKALYAFLSALSNQKERILKVRKDRAYDVRPTGRTVRFFRHTADGVLEDYFRGLISYTELETGLAAAFREAGETWTPEDCRLWAEQIRAIRDVSDADLLNAIAARRFASVFHGQFLPLGQSASAVSRIQLEDGGRLAEIRLSRDRTDCIGEADTSRRVFYIDGPQVLEALEMQGAAPSGADVAEYDLCLSIYRRQTLLREHPDTAAFTDLEMKDRLQAVWDCLRGVLPGRVVYTEQKRFVFHDDALNADLELSNLSTGLKVFALLQILVANGVLQPGNIVILDEPEVHLHPAWQIVYAEVITLLCRHFGLTFLLTSHSSDLLDALQSFAEKYGISERMHAYVSEESPSHPGCVTFSRVDDNNWDRLYERFLATADRLHALRN